MAEKPAGGSFMDMFTSFGRELKLPTMDVEAILEHNRRNLEALQQSAQASAKGATDIMQRQRDMLREQMQAITDAAQSLNMGGNPQDALRKQADFVKQSFEMAVRNTGEIAQMAQKSGAESVDILRKRIAQSMNEIRQNAEKAK